MKKEFCLHVFSTLPGRLPCTEPGEVVEFYFDPINEVFFDQTTVIESLLTPEERALYKEVQHEMDQLEAIFGIEGYDLLSFHTLEDALEMMDAVDNEHMIHHEQQAFHAPGEAVHQAFIEAEERVRRAQGKAVKGRIKLIEPTPLPMGQPLDMRSMFMQLFNEQAPRQLH